jgi:microcystin-dependent protein
MATANATVRAVLDYLNQKSSSSVPTGAICYFATTAIPTGWLLCNGSNVSRTTYAALFAAIGTKFGTGNGSSTFTLPNLDERFIEGTTTTSDVGKKLEAGLPNITGQLAPYDSTAEAYTGAFLFVGTSNGVTSNWREIRRGGIDASRSSSLYGASATVQPPALELLPCIKI